MTKPLEQHLRELIGKLLEDTKADTVCFSSFEATEAVMQKLVDNNVRFKVVLGKYKSTYEVSFLIAAEHLEWLFSSELIDGQESIMTIASDQTCNLFYPKLNDDGSVRIEDIGTLSPITPEMAKQIAAWTYDPTAGLYFGTVEKAA